MEKCGKCGGHGEYVDFIPAYQEKPMTTCCEACNGTGVIDPSPVPSTAPESKWEVKFWKVMDFSKTRDKIFPYYITDGETNIPFANEEDANKVLADLNALQGTREELEQTKSALSASERFRKEDGMSHINEANGLREQIVELTNELNKSSDDRLLLSQENERLKAEAERVAQQNYGLKQGIEELKANCRLDLKEYEGKLVAGLEQKTEGFYNGCATTNRIILQELTELLPSPEQTPVNTGKEQEK